MESEFLTESTQKLRKSLLISSLIGFAISYAGLRVSEVSLLGSKLSITKFEVIPLVLCIIVLYFLVTFTIFGLYDYSQGYRKLRYDALERISKGTVSSRQEAEKALKELKGELEDLSQMPLSEYMEPSKGEARLSRIQEIRKEVTKLEQVLKFFRYYRGSFFERLKLRGMRTFFDLFLPILVGIYVLILLFFFTKIPELQSATAKPEKEVTIGLRLSFDDANNITSYSLIEKSESDEKDKQKQVE